MEQQTIASFLAHAISLVIAIIVLSIVVWNLWLHYVNTVYLRSIEWIMLEITPPKEVFKSPEAMELVFNALHGGAVTNWYLKYWKGELGLFYSLEIASIEGKIHFYVRFHKKFRKVFEASLYSQYPQAEIKEVEDYAAKVPEYTNENGAVKVFGYNLILEKEDPYPIKSYVDYGLDRAVGSLDEEQRIDPITPMIEIMGSIGTGEQLWVQILIRQDTKRFEVKKKDGEKEIIETGKSWKDKAKEVIDNLRKELNPVDKDGKVTPIRPTKGQLNVIEAIERHKNKAGFDTGIRVMYVAEPEKYNGNTISAFTTMFRQFGTEDMNKFKFDGMTKPPDEPWKDLGGKKTILARKFMLEDYKKRNYFYGGFDFNKIKTYFTSPEQSGKKPFILSTEELATLYHLPGKVVETPTFMRIDAKKSEPPSNLPI